jgi:hypothetical protein
MPAYTHRWLKTRNTPTVTTFECRPYDAEVVHPDPDMSEAAAQLQHAQQQLELSKQYPGRTPHISSRRMFKPRVVK